MDGSCTWLIEMTVSRASLHGALRAQQYVRSASKARAKDPGVVLLLFIRGQYVLINTEYRFKETHLSKTASADVCINSRETYRQTE